MLTSSCCSPKRFDWLIPPCRTASFTLFCWQGVICLKISPVLMWSCQIHWNSESFFWWGSHVLRLETVSLAQFQYLFWWPGLVICQAVRLVQLMHHHLGEVLQYSPSILWGGHWPSDAKVRTQRSGLNLVSCISCIIIRYHKHPSSRMIQTQAFHEAEKA